MIKCFRDKRACDLQKSVIYESTFLLDLYMKREENILRVEICVATSVFEKKKRL